jgi:hypothetical protein
VTGELKIHWVTRNCISIVGLMRQQNGSFTSRNVVQGLGEVCRFAEHVVYPRQPEAHAVALNGDGLIGKHFNSLGAQRAGNPIGIGECIMVPQHSPESMGRLQPPEQMGARLGNIGSLRMLTKKRLGHEITGQNDQFRMQLIDEGNGGTDRVDREVRVVMEVAEQCDVESVEVRWPATQPNFASHKLWAIGLNEQAVGAERGNTRARCETDELSPVNRKQWQSVFWATYLRLGQTLSSFRITQPRTSLNDKKDPSGQKLKVATRSMRRLAVVPGE